MHLGAFSISLSVKNLAESKAFYEKLGFKAYAGDEQSKYLIMKNGDTNIGLFEGMFDGNILTFNPGWDLNAQTLDEFTDVRAIHQTLVDQNVAIEHAAIEGDKGPSNFVLKDPDGNVILIDQHV